MIRKYHYAWTIIFITFLALFAIQGVRLSFGAFIEPWENEFHMNRSTTSLISMVSFIVLGISQPFIGRLIDYFGARLIISASCIIVAVSIFLTSFATSIWQLFVLYGVTMSIGVGGVSNVVAAVVITQWFTTKRGLAFGLVEAGAGAGQMLVVPTALMMIHTSGWKVAVIVMSAMLMFIILPIVLFMFKDKPENMELEPVGGREQLSKSDETEKKGITFIQAVKMKNFWFLILSFGVCGFTTTGLMDTHLIPYAHDHGYSVPVTTAAVSTLAAFNIIGTLLSGIIADRWSSRKLLLTLYAVRAMTMIILLTSHHSLLLLIFAVLFGLVDFATVAPTQMLAIYAFKDYAIGFIMGWIFLSHQIGSALGAYLPGLIFSHHHSYNPAFILSIAILIFSAGLVFLLPDPYKQQAPTD